MSAGRRIGSVGQGSDQDYTQLDTPEEYRADDDLFTVEEGIHLAPQLNNRGKECALRSKELCHADGITYGG